MSATQHGRAIAVTDPIWYAHEKLSNAAAILADDSLDLRYRLRLTYSADPPRHQGAGLWIIGPKDMPTPDLRRRLIWIRTRMGSVPFDGNRSGYERSCEAMSDGAVREVADAILAMHRDVAAFVEGGTP